MKSVTGDIKCWGDSKEKEDTHRWRDRSHIYNTDPISSTSALCRGKAFKVTSPALLVIPFLRTCIHSFTAPIPPVMEWIGWHRSRLEGHIYFHYNQEFQWKHFAETKVVTFL